MDPHAGKYIDKYFTMNGIILYYIILTMHVAIIYICHKKVTQYLNFKVGEKGV